jgi:hypothetical protein
MSGLLTSDYADPTTASAVALGGPTAPTPLGNPAPRPRPEQNPAAAPTSVAAPKNSENNLTLARRQREQGENPSRDPNAQNPYSSAGGNNQIIDGTWLELMNKHHPEMVQGQSKEQILAMKTNGPLNDEMAAKYDEDNARMLASNGIAPTPNFINAAYRAGPQGAMAIIKAARENPGALVRDVAPEMATPGNNGAGNLTVGQFLMNPYQKGPGGQENDTPQQMFTIARGNQILAQMMQDNEAGKARVAALDKDYKPIEIPKPPKPPENDPLKTFSSIAGLFATLAAGFSRTPAIAAMNGLAGAMDAAKKNDWETYKAQYDQFKTSSDLAMKAHEQHSADVKDALEMMTKNMAAGTSMLNATIALSDDEEMRKHMQIGDYVTLGKLADDRKHQAEEWALNQPVAEATLQLTAAMHNRDDAVKSGDPEAVRTADLLVTQAENRVAEVKRAMAGGGKALTPQAIAVQKFIEANPNATAKDIQDFTLGFKEDAPGVGARKDRDLNRKERLDQLNADHRDRMATIAEDRNISTIERDRRLAEERERHDKATETLGEHKAVTADRVQDERERHNSQIEQITSNRDLSHNDLAVQVLDERIKHDRAMEGKDHTTAAERQTKMYEDDIRKDPKFADASDSEVRTEANRRITASKKPEAQHLNPDALDMEAKQLLLTGTMPSMGFGGTDTRVQIINRAAELAAEQGHGIEDYIAGRATWKADTSSLGQITKISDAVQAFENTALANMKVAESLMDKGAGTKLGPVINQWLQAGKVATGNPDVAAFNLAMGTVASEYGKIISGGSASIAATPEGARQEAQEWLNKIQSPQAIKAQFAAARKDMENRKTSLFQQRSLIQDRIKDPLAPPQTQSAVPTPAGPRENEKGQSKSGRPIIYRSGHWEYDDASPG